MTDEPSAGALGYQHRDGPEDDERVRTALPLPDAPALLSTADGLVVRATEHAVRLAGLRCARELTGRRLADLVVRHGDRSVLRTSAEDVPVRALTWRHSDSADLWVTVLVDLSDVAAPRAAAPEDDDHARLLEAQQLARVGSFAYYPDTGEFYRSPILTDFLAGSRAGEVDDAHALVDFTFAADRHKALAFYRGLFEGPPGSVREAELRDLPGKRVYLCTGRAEHDRSGRVVRVFGTVQDVTEHRAAVTRMERTSKRFTDLVHITPVGIGLFDPAERLVTANDALCELLGYRLEELRGRGIQDLAHPADQPVALAELPGERRRRVPHRVLVRADGEPVHCELHVSSSVQDDGTRFWLVVFQDVTERRRAAEALRYQATHDDLTGLPNRAAVKELLRSLLGGADPVDVAVLFCDIDNFKRINDSLGHDAGDELLVALARRLEGGLPDCCTAARLSGDEFVIICSDVGAVGGLDSVATRVSGLLRTAVPVHGQLIRVSASIGAAVPSGPGAGGEDLLRFADAAMFEAKRRGSGRVSLASPALMASADRQLQLEGQLREALHRDGLTLHYQPVVAPDGSVVTAEALVRWPHPDRGLLAPDAFLPVAEQGDLLRDLDRWVLRTALREAARWPRSGGRQVGVAVNLAGLVPGGPDFVDTVTDVVAETGLDWHRVVLELVETALVDLPSRTRQEMAELVARGVRFAVDDFGTGYSSLARLKELPAQIIKVDRRFVAGVGGDASDFAVARAVVDMARAMGRYCVAEGVETATQFHALCGVGVDAYQGWLFAKAMPARDFRALLADGPLATPTP
ncbi:putative bifunctional diguanylate cyclase/phosphodiesterase [Saccharopolyspora cebuensis]|uniref:putative bifunctional diguanylate cyclase/phosphodiesterase n=1 Tax=Saccharopolyspora cebuensis TaxID=418759 RepID=UPI00337EAF75